MRPLPLACSTMVIVSSKQGRGHGSLTFCLLLVFVGHVPVRGMNGIDPVLKRRLRFQRSGGPWLDPTAWSLELLTERCELFGRVD